MDTIESEQSTVIKDSPSHHTTTGRKGYRLLGTGLVIAGLGLTPVSHILIESIPLTALGLSIIVLGAVCLALDITLPKIPTGVSLILMESSVENIASLIEELGLRSRGVYVPSSSMTEGKVQALIPLKSNGAPLEFGGPISRRLIVKYGPADADVGLLVSTPGSAAVEMLDSKPGSSASEMGMALTSLIVGAIDAADAVSVFADSQRVTVEISGSRVHTDNTRLHECLGTPLASIAASVASEALDKPVTIEQEYPGKRGKYTVQLRVMNEGI